MEAPANHQAVEEPALDLSFYWRLICRRRWWFVGTFIVVVAAVGIATITATPIYEASTKVLVEQTTPAPMSLSGDLLSGLLALGGSGTLLTQMEIIKSRSVMEPALKQFGLKANSPYLTISVQNQKATDVISILCQYKDPQTAAKIANAIAHQHIQRALERSGENAQQGRQLVEKQLASAGSDLRKVEKELEAFRTESGVTAISEGASNLVEALQTATGEANQLRAQARAGRLEQAAIRRQIAKETPKIENQATIIRNPAVDALEGKLRELELERARLASDYTASSQKMRTLEEQIEKVRSQIENEAQRVVTSQTLVDPVQASLVAQLAAAEVRSVVDNQRSLAADQALKELRAKVDRLPADQLKAAALQRAATLAESRFVMLSKKLEELKLMEDARMPSASILDEARPNPDPVKPNKLRNLVLGLVLGVMFGLVTVAVMSVLDGTFGSVEEVRQVLGLPVLATVPSMADRGALLLGPSSDRGVFPDAFQRLYARLRHLNSQRPLSSLAVVGSATSGCSMVARNLATVCASRGWKVALVDVDPDHAQDLEEIAAPQRLDDGGDLIYPTCYPNLFVTTTAPLPTSEGEIADVDALQTFLSGIGQQVDLTVIDMPPRIASSDEIGVVGTCSAAIMVVDLAHTRRADSKRMVDSYRQEGLPVLGVVANNVPMPSDRAHS